MTEGRYDAIVLGLGGMGSAAAYHLAKRGRRVLGLDAYERGHTRGSSHGRTRIIRKAYAEGASYVPLVQRAYELWRELESESGKSLLTITGGLGIGPEEGRMVEGVLESARAHGLPHEYLGAAEVNRRFPGFQLPENLVAAYEPDAGYLEPEACIAAHLDLAAAHGAEIQHSNPVSRWEADGAGVRVEAQHGDHRADRLIVAAGPWTGEVLSGLGLPLTVRRIVNVFFEPETPELFAPEHCPIHYWELPTGIYYGVPWLPGEGLKFGRHDAGDACTPETIEREVAAFEVENLRVVLNRYMPGSAFHTKSFLTCMYTMTPDEHFIIDRHPAHAQVVFGCGFSGHGFKFATVVGEVLADLAISGETRHPIGFLSASRFR